MRKLALLILAAPVILAAPAFADPAQQPPTVVDPCQLGYAPDMTVRDAQGHLVPPLPCPLSVQEYGPQH